ncbi:hypothetical protein NDU88_001949 [Pleurodeles waltl]|uniref:Uncharacterized protein n=1 Tax=Pleurodeles waltl TaxID=8319 RepID=A0AAV7T0Y2_PLEWA|nr:hypothetical protein NDU88_001949 [Pleurodeles waltl]
MGVGAYDGEPRHRMRVSLFSTQKLPAHTRSQPRCYLVAGSKRGWWCPGSGSYGTQAALAGSRTPGHDLKAPRRQQQVDDVVRDARVLGHGQHVVTEDMAGRSRALGLRRGCHCGPAARA